MSVFDGLILTTQRTLGTIPLDAVLQDDNTSTINLTQFPVESGSIITDHRIILPKVYKLRGVISGVNTIGNLNALAGFAGNGTSSVYDELIRLQESAELITITSGLKVYTNLVIKSINAAQDVDTANILIFDVSLEEVLIVNSKSVDIPADKVNPDQRNRASSTTNEGVKNKDDIGDIRAPENSSTLIKMGKAVKRGSGF